MSDNKHQYGDSDAQGIHDDGKRSSQYRGGKKVGHFGKMTKEDAKNTYIRVAESYDNGNRSVRSIGKKQVFQSRLSHVTWTIIKKRYLCRSAKPRSKVKAE
jgi:hypothetical protein